MKSILKRILNKVFLRNVIAEIQRDVMSLHKKAAAQRARIELVAATIDIVERKLDYVSRKMDVHAEFDDQMRRQLQRTLNGVGSQLSLEKLGEQIEASTATTTREIRRTGFNEFRQTEALGSLQTLLALERPLPPTRGWAGSPDFLLHLYQHIAEARPETVVELGSGVSSIVIASALRAAGTGRLHSLEHDSAHAARTRRELAAQGLSGFADIHDAPLVDWHAPRPTELGETWKWYEVPQAVAELRTIDLLVIDGPPKGTGAYARYPAVPQFRQQLAPGATVLLDDAIRQDDRTAAHKWHADWDLELELRLRTQREFEKGLAILTVPGAPRDTAG